MPNKHSTCGSSRNERFVIETSALSCAVKLYLMLLTSEYLTLYWTSIVTSDINNLVNIMILCNQIGPERKEGLTCELRSARDNDINLN